MRLDVQGAATIRRIHPEAVLIFLIAGSEEELVERLRSRHTDTDEAIKMRIATAHQEYKRMEEFDYCVTNPQCDVNAAVDRVLAIIQAEHARVKQRKIHI